MSRLTAACIACLVTGAIAKAGGGGAKGGAAKGASFDSDDSGLADRPKLNCTPLLLESASSCTALCPSAMDWVSCATQQCENAEQSASLLRDTCELGVLAALRNLSCTCTVDCAAVVESGCVRLTWIYILVGLVVGSGLLGALLAYLDPTPMHGAPRKKGERFETSSRYAAMLTKMVRKKGVGAARQAEAVPTTDAAAAKAAAT